MKMPLASQNWPKLVATVQNEQKKNDRAAIKTVQILAKFGQNG